MFIMLRNINNFGALVISSRSLQTATSTVTNFPTNYKIEHDTKRQKFRVNFDPDNEAFLKYERLGNNEVLLHHTEIPEKFRNSDVAKILAQEAFKHFEDTKQKMIITCTYLQKVDKQRKST